MPKVGLVTVLYKSDSVLDGFFKSLFNQSFTDYILFIVDNSPNEGTDQLLRDLGIRFPIKSYRYIRSESNIGVAAGNNVGIRLAIEAACEYVLLLNNDIEFYRTDLIEAMVRRADSSTQKLFVPKIKFFDSELIWMAGGSFNKVRGTVVHYGEGLSDSPQFSVEKIVEYAPTCFILIHGEVFKRVGLMDEKYFVYYDDTDFLFRVKSAGYEILYLPDLEVLHKVSSSTGGGETPFLIYYGNRNRVYFIRKNFVGAEKIIAISFTILTRIVKWVTYPRDKRSVLIKSIFDGFKL